MQKIEIKDLNLYYESFQALKGVTLSIEANIITAFIGPSGCGKSTLLKTINRMNDLIEVSFCLTEKTSTVAWTLPYLENASAWCFRSQILFL